MVFLLSSESLVHFWKLKLFSHSSLFRLVAIQENHKCHLIYLNNWIIPIYTNIAIRELMKFKICYHMISSYPAM